MRNLWMSILPAALFTCAAAQNVVLPDSASGIKSVNLNELVICDQQHQNLSAAFYRTNQLATTEDIMSRMNGVSLIRRGAYGMEPVLRVYSAGQINLTINGMRIFGACTDKMDPATIYIEPNNLQQMRASHGAVGNETGSSVGGTIDMVMKQAELSHCYRTSASAAVSYSSVNHAVNAGSVINMSFNKVALRLNGTYRKAFNYRAGGNKEVLYSQYEKVNYGTSLAFKLSESHKMTVDYIGDLGWNIGYPALTMDAGKAAANIAALTHIWQPENSVWQNVQSKVYFNHIYHAMDDTRRDDTLMHMDMPGLSYTMGWFTDLNLQAFKNNLLKIRADYAMNFSKAEMTMYPENATPMFMLTLPDNRRHFSGIYVSDVQHFGELHSLSVNARFEYLHAGLSSEFGRNQARIFTPNAITAIHRFVPSASVGYTTLFAKRFTSKLTASYGERAPNANEFFGFYLYNRFDGFDYIGSHHLKNEQSLQAEWNLGFESTFVNVDLSAYYNHLYNYIIGNVMSEVSAMTQGARGVKQYANVGGAMIAGGEMRLTVNEIKGFWSMHSAKYSYAQLSNGDPMPLVPPLKCFHTVRYSIKGWHIQAEAEWALAQNRTNATSGEQTTPAYGLFHFRTGYKRQFGIHILSFNFAVENVADLTYREHLDWGNIPRAGRNFTVGIAYVFTGGVN